MNTFKKLTLTLFCFILLGLTSCNKIQKPEGMPELYPAKITIVQEGTPLEGAVVTLLNQDASQSKWVVGGRTDANGVCLAKTYGKYSGAPAGKYKVVVAKTEKTEGETAKQPPPQDHKALEEYNIKRGKEAKWYDYVDVQYKSEETTDLEIEITIGKNEQTIDVGKAIKKEYVSRE
ncbi:MAG: carboxypeptidase-like regulatory domain-containing protein [Planctomycetaceae bacterium]|jgi:5-hydroxyisourate hydrolase-like protein (transthyretin family)|nr:carboxypeptidase-like regulatory domain-containing protein [Planctomycetaceae bacterium]